MEGIGNAKGTLKIIVPDRRNLTGNALLEHFLEDQKIQWNGAKDDA